MRNGKCGAISLYPSPPIVVAIAVVMPETNIRVAITFPLFNLGTRSASKAGRALSLAATANWKSAEEVNT